MTLYRKYRPQIFADFINQKPIKLTIQNQIAIDRIVHAYLFTGPRGTGKTTMARLLAKALNCSARQKGQFEPCGNCQNCQEIAKGISLDLSEKDAASNRGIDEIREITDSSIVFYMTNGEELTGDHYLSISTEENYFADNATKPNMVDPKNQEIAVVIMVAS